MTEQADEELAPLYIQWIEKAESDYLVARRAAQAGDQALSAEVVCFHVQQCIEKYAKAFLQEQGISSERTDSQMTFLYSQCASIASEFHTYQSDFKRLDDFGIDLLYPGRSADENDAREAMVSLTRMREFTRRKLGLDRPPTPKGD